MTTWFYLDAAVARRWLRQLNALGESLRLYRRLRIAELLPDFGIIASIGYNVATSVQDPTAAFMNRLNGLGAGIGLGMRLASTSGPKTARLLRSTAELRQYEARRQRRLPAVRSRSTDLQRLHRSDETPPRRRGADAGPVAGYKAFNRTSTSVPRSRAT